MLLMLLRALLCHIMVYRERQTDTRKNLQYIDKVRLDDDDHNISANAKMPFCKGLPEHIKNTAQHPRYCLFFDEGNKYYCKRGNQIRKENFQNPAKNSKTRSVPPQPPHNLNT